MANKKPVHLSVDPSVRRAIEAEARKRGMRRGALASRLVLRGLGTLKRSLACPEVACAPKRGSDRLTVYLEPAMSGLAQCRFHDSTRAGSVRRALFAGLAPDVAEESLASDYGAGEGVEPPKAEPEPGPLARRVPELGRAVDPGDPDDLRAAIGDLESAARDLEAKAEACDREARAFTDEIARDGLPAGSSALAKLEEARRNVEAGRAFARNVRARQRELEAAGGQATAQAWAFEDTEHRFWSDLDAKMDGPTLSVWPDGEPAGPRAPERAKDAASFGASERCVSELDRLADRHGMFRSEVAAALIRRATGGKDRGLRVDAPPERGSRTVTLSLSKAEKAAVEEAFPANGNLSESLRRAVFAPSNRSGEPEGKRETARGRHPERGPRVQLTATISDACLAEIDAWRDIGDWSRAAVVYELVRRALYGESTVLGLLRTPGAYGRRALNVRLTPEEARDVFAFAPDAPSKSEALRRVVFAPRNLVAGVGEPGDAPERIAGRLEGVAERVAAEAEGGGVLADVSDADLAAELSRRLGEARA